MKVTILGSNSATQIFDRHPSAQVVDVNGSFYLIDCGEGTLFRLNAFRIKRSKLKAVFISHLHGDHYFGIMGLLTTMSLNQREKELHLICPSALKNIIESQTSELGSHLSFDIKYTFHDDTESQEVYSDENISVSNIPLHHRVMTCGFRIEKKYPEYKFIEDKIASFGLKGEEIKKLKNGEEVYKNDATITLQNITVKNTESSVYSYCSDTRYDEQYLPIINKSNLLYHESTFMEADKDRAIKTYHSTTKEAALIAKKSNSTKLIIGHFSSRYKDLNPLLEEAREIFPNTELAIEGHAFEV